MIMRKLGIGILFFMGSFVIAFGQNDASTAGPKGISPEVRKKINKAKDRLVLDLFMATAFVKKDGGVTVPDNFKLNAFNRGANVYFMYDLVLGKKTKPQHFSIAPGLGVGSENYYFKGFGMKWRGDSVTRFYPLGDSITSKNSKLNMTYIDIPVEFRYRSTPSKKTGMSGKFAVGFKLGFMIASKWKYKGEALDNSSQNVKIKDIGVANMSRLRYGPYIRGGYGPFNVFCYYSISNIFTANKGPQMNPLIFGISINGL